MNLVAIALAVLAAGSGGVAPSDLLAASAAPEGFELASEPPTDLTFEGYAPLSPDATAHVEPGSEAAQAMRAAVDVWTSTDDDIVLREVTRWGSDADARAFVEQAVVVGTEDGLDRVDPPFEGGVAFFGADNGLWTRTVSWRQGPYGMTVAHYGISEGDFDIVDTAATELADQITEATGRPVERSVVDEEPAQADSGGGIGLGTVVLWVTVIGGVMWLIARLRRRSASNEWAPHRTQGHDRGSGDPTDEDDDIERARARSRARRGIDRTPDPTRRPPDD